MANQQDIDGIINVIKSYMNKLSTICDAEQKQEVLLDLSNDLFNDVLMPNKPYKGTVWVVSSINPDKEREIYGVFSSADAADEAVDDLKQSVIKVGLNSDILQIKNETYPVLD